MKKTLTVVFLRGSRKAPCIINSLPPLFYQGSNFLLSPSFLLIKVGIAEKLKPRRAISQHQGIGRSRKRGELIPALFAFTSADALKNHAKSQQQNEIKATHKTSFYTPIVSPFFAQTRSSRRGMMGLEDPERSSNRNAAARKQKIPVAKKASFALLLRTF